MEITWQGVFAFCLLMVAVCFIEASIVAAHKERKRRDEQAKREELQRRGKTS